MLVTKEYLADIAKRKSAAIGKSIEKSAKSSFPVLNDFEGNCTPGCPYSVVRHTHSWVHYQGVSTTIPISIIGREALPSTRRIKLQKRGWRTGILGWKAGRALGGKIGKEIDVTPEYIVNWDSETIVEKDQRNRINKNLAEFARQTPRLLKDHEIQETDFIRIPVCSGDGYFRLVIYPSESSNSALAFSEVFRLGSLGLKSSQIRGASMTTLGPEVLLKSTISAVRAATTGAVYATVPFAKTIHLVPGTKKIGNWVVQQGVRRIGSEVIVEEIQIQAEESIHQKVGPE